MTDSQSPDHDHLWQDGAASRGQPAGATARTGGARRRHPSPARRSPWLAIAGYGALGLACLVLGAVTFLFIASPADLVRDRLIEQVKARTGRDLVVSGPASVSLFPRPGVALAGVSLSAPPGMDGAAVVAMQRLDVDVRPWRLLSRQIAVTRLVLHRPTIELRVDAQGRRSWDFAEASPRPVRLAQAGTKAGDAGHLPVELEEFVRSARARRGAAALQKLGLEQVLIVDGVVRYQDERTGARREFTSLDLALTLPDASGPLEAKGSLAWGGEKLSFEATVAPFGAVLDQQPALLGLKIAGPLTAAYEGSLDVAAGIALDGKVHVQAPSVHLLRTLLGKPSPADHDSPLAVSAQLAAADGRVTLTKLAATLGEASLGGTLAVETKGARPYVQGNLQLSELDFGAIFVRSAGRGGESRGAATAPAAGRADPIDDVLRRGGPAGVGTAPGRGKRAGAAWSDDPIDPSVLRLADADLELSVGRLVYKDVKTGRSRLAVAIKGGVARIALEDMQLYGGRGRGHMTLDGSGQALATAANLQLEGVSVLPLLEDALSFEWLDGRGAIALSLTGQGLSERQLVETANGRIGLAIAGGAIVGIDIAKIVRGLEQGRIPAVELSPSERTSFSELAASFEVANGMVHNQDMRLASPHLRVSGAGSIDLPKRAVDYTVRPKFAGSASNPGAVVKIGEIEVPLRIKGPWSKPTFTPDIKGIAKSEQAAETLKQIGKNLKSQEVQDALKGLLSGDKEQRVKPRELIEKLLKKE